MPPANEQRRQAIADAAIDLLAEAGVHGVTHRAVERRAGLPTGTVSNYYRSREALLVGVANRVVQLHFADMTRAASAHRHSFAGSASTRDQLTELLTGSLFEAATSNRYRYLAIFELRLESLRRPALAVTLDHLVAKSMLFTADHHAELQLAVSPADIPVLVMLYGGALYTLVTAPPGSVTVDGARSLAAAIVSGALPPAG